MNNNNNNNNPQRLHPSRPGGATGNGNSSRSSSSSTWFSGAPASKVLLAFTVILFVLVRDKKTSLATTTNHVLALDSDAMTTYRYLTSKLTFSSTGDLVLGTALLFFLLRKYEREMGTRKFIVFWLLVQGLAIVQEMACLSLLTARNRVLDRPNPTRWCYAGPYAILGAFFTLFHITAPRLYPRFITIFQFHLSEKSFYYLWFFHLIGSGGWHTIVPTLTGIVAGWGLYYFHSPIVSQIDIPESIVRMLQPVFDALGLTDPSHNTIIPPVAAAAPTRVPNPTTTGRTSNNNNNNSRPFMMEERHDSTITSEIPLPDEADPAAVEQLISMGFARTQVIDALRQSHNNIEHAANRLLMSSTSG
jgi:hypothetical protein